MPGTAVLCCTDCPRHTQMQSPGLMRIFSHNKYLGAQMPAHALLSSLAETRACSPPCSVCAGLQRPGAGPLHRGGSAQALAGQACRPGPPSAAPSLVRAALGSADWYDPCAQLPNLNGSPVSACHICCGYPMGECVAHALSHIICVHAACPVHACFGS